jgi:hypothetical protein
LTLIWACISHALSFQYIYNKDGNDYPVNRVFARTSDYLIPKSVFGYSENFSLWRKNRESWIFIGIIFLPRKRISYWHLRVFESLHRLKNFQTLDVGGGIHLFRRKESSRQQVWLSRSFETDCHRLALTKLFPLAKTLYHNDRIAIMNVTWHNLICK